MDGDCNSEEDGNNRMNNILEEAVVSCNEESRKSTKRKLSIGEGRVHFTPRKLR